jgi:hypothetical protein
LRWWWEWFWLRVRGWLWLWLGIRRRRWWLGWQWWKLWLLYSGPGFFCHAACTVFLVRGLSVRAGRYPHAGY